MNAKELKTEIDTLTVFSSLRSDKVISALRRFADDPDSESYCSFVSLLYSANGGKLDAYIDSLLSSTDNFYIRHCGKDDGFITKEVESSAARELSILSMIASIRSGEMKSIISTSLPLPDFSSGNIDIVALFKERMANVGKYGYGIFANNRMFFVNDDGAIVPVKHPDETRLSDLIGYELERNKVIDNTKALLGGKPAANALLTGDAGTGKSSTVKAVVNELYTEGLRIVEVRKDQITKVGSLLDDLAENPLKFIIFIDDLSFSSGDDSFSQLKAILEGSVSARSRNVVIYATSNRRHVVNERFSDREGDEIHRNDTMQELMSLSERFGLRVTFGKPDKKTYIGIVSALAEKDGIHMPEDELSILAERFALEHGGRSARLARQFVDSLLSR